MSQFPLPFNLDQSIASPLTGLNFGLAPIDWQQETEAAASSELTTIALTPIEVQLAQIPPSTLAVRRTPTTTPQLSLAPIEQSSQLRSGNLLLGQVSTLVQPSPQQTPRFATPAMIEWQALLSPAIDLALTQLQTFAASPAFAETLRLSFGGEVNVQRARPLINRLTLIGHPTNPLGRIQVISDPPLDISGAYAPDTKTIYLTAAFLNNNATDPSAVAAALLEEVGHHIDATLNRTDRPGDEGELFSALVQGRSIDAAELLRLQTEDDTATLLLNGQAVRVEQSTGVTLTGNANNNRLDGQGGHDLLSGLGGNDQLFGWNGDDRLFGGTGNDELRGGAGSDYLAGEDGNDQIFGADGADDLRGQAGDDYLVGGNGWDVFFGGTGNDTYVIDRADEWITEQAGQGIDLVQATTNYNLEANLENLTFLEGAEWGGNGNDLNNSIFGNTSRNVIQGLAGNDWIAGGAGNDDLYGNTGFDILVGGDGEDTLVSGTEDDTLFGEAGNDRLFGEAGNDVLYGQAGNDYLDGNIGFDVLVGGDGDDRLVGWTENDTLYGEAGNDTLEGGDGEDTLVGGTENDTLFGEAGNDTLYGEAGNDWLEGRTEDDRLFGGEGNDTLQGQAGNDRLDGESGSDLLIGGFGNDIYVVDSFADIVQEFIGEGTDWVEAGISYFLGSQVENLALTGAASINGTGNELNNILQGNAGDNQLDGGVGFDTLIGGAGNDIYIVDSPNDVVSEADPAGGVRDAVRSSVTYNLGNNLETLELTGTAAIDGTGNDLSNTIVGNVNNNTLIGGAGNDWINGSGGIDRLTGGAGADRFVLGTAAASFYDDGSVLTFGIKNYALMTDFNPAEDIIELQGATISGSSLQIQGTQAANYFLAAVPAGMPFGTGTGIYRDKPGEEFDELLGIINVPNQYPFNIEAVQPVMGGDTGQAPATVDPVERNIQFQIVSAGGANNWSLNQRWDGRQVWVVIHGWNGDYFQFQELAESVRNAKPNDIVLALDWTNASGGLGIEEGIEGGFDNVGNTFTRGNFYAANWIGPVADVVSDQLRRWGMASGASLNFVGHSLGSLLSSEIAFRFAGGVNTITALDPPSEQNRLVPPLPYSGGYRYLRNGQFEVRPVRFDAVSRFSRAFTGRNSTAGNKEFARWADEAILMDFRRLVDGGQEHGYVIDAFQKLIDPTQSPHLARELFSLDDYAGRDEEFRQDAYEPDTFNGQGFEGVLEVDPGTHDDKTTRNTLYFTAFNGESSGMSDQYIYGTSNPDTIDIFAGIVNGRPVDTATFSGNHVYYGGKGNDRIIGGIFATSATGNDKMFGDEGNGTLDGRVGRDTLAGVNPDNLRPGLNEIDRLTGGVDPDLFVLGDRRRTYYVGNEELDYALITDFSRAEDAIQLKGSQSDYQLANSPISAHPGTAIYRRESAVDVYFLYDVSGSFTDDLALIDQSSLMTVLFESLRGSNPSIEFGIGTFGGKDWGNSIYSHFLSMTNNTAAMEATIDTLRSLDADDKSQLEALHHIAKNSTSTSNLVGFRANTTRVAVVLTDESFGVSGSLGLPPNDGDSLLSRGEDYLTVNQLKDGLLEAGIFPVFAVTSDVTQAYQSVVNQLGFGQVVTLGANSSNLVDAVRTGIQQTDGVRDLIGIIAGVTPTSLSLANSPNFLYV